MAAITYTAWTQWTTTAGTASVTTGTGYCQYVWNQWTTSSTTSAIPITSGAVTTYQVTIPWNDWVETVEQKQAREQRQIEEAIAWEAGRADREARAETERVERAARLAADKERKEMAERRALVLLLSILNEEQRKEYQEKKQFHVRSRNGKRYQISRGVSQNIHEVDEQGLRLVNFCAHPDAYDIPTEDHMVAQKLFLENSEEEFLKVANRSQARRMAA